jgi:segregation and condensation protein B
MNTLAQKIESLLFYKNEPLSFSWLSKHLETSEVVIKKTLKEMRGHYLDRGVVLVVHEETASLMTSPISSRLINDLAKRSDERELSKQALETLAVIAYKGKITKSEIDYIRGVNSLFILRNLTMRGLIGKKINILDKRSPLYVLTQDTLSLLGIVSKDELPDQEKIRKKLDQLESDFNQENTYSEIIEVGDRKK